MTLPWLRIKTGSPPKPQAPHRSPRLLSEAPAPGPRPSIKKRTYPPYRFKKIQIHKQGIQNIYWIRPTNVTVSACLSSNTHILCTAAAFTSVIKFCFVLFFSLFALNNCYFSIKNYFWSDTLWYCSQSFHRLLFKIYFVTWYFNRQIPVMPFGAASCEENVHKVTEGQCSCLQL